MRTSTISLICALTIFSQPCRALDTTSEEQQCAAIGFQQKTEAFGNCVLELLQRRQNQKPVRTVGGSDEARSCLQFGFLPRSREYSECLLSLELAKRRAQERESDYAFQQAEYKKQLMEYEKERERQRSMKQLELGLRMMGGQNVNDAVRGTAGLAPLAPNPPGPTIQTIILPGGRQVTCSIVGTFTNCN